MAFGTDNGKTTGVSHSLSLRGNFSLELIVIRLIGLSRINNIGVGCVGKTGGFGNHFFTKTIVAQGSFCQVFGVTTKHNIGTTASHISSNGNGAKFAGLGDNFSFFFMVFSI